MGVVAAIPVSVQILDQIDIRGILVNDPTCWCSNCTRARQVEVDVLLCGLGFVPREAALRVALELELQVVQVVLLGTIVLREVALQLEHIGLVLAVHVGPVAISVQVQHRVDPIEAAPHLPHPGGGQIRDVRRVQARVVVALVVPVQILRDGGVGHVGVDDPALDSVAAAVAVHVVVYELVGLKSLEVASPTHGGALLAEGQAIQEVLVLANAAQLEHHGSRRHGFRNERCARISRRAGGRGRSRR
mmetsp:Transcript_91600/g.233061  ORF Transcript_91600/g.233061 Transcript_91600/m.233061 type:complete len:246 (-) Transcript_91600:38-775(-)